MQQLILGTGTAIWWLTEPHWLGLWPQVSNGTELYALDVFGAWPIECFIQHIPQLSLEIGG